MDTIVMNAVPAAQHAARYERMRRPTTFAELHLLEDAQSRLDFTMLVPRSVPLGYRLVGVDMLDHCRTLVTFVLRRSRDWMKLTQHTSDVSLEAELLLTQQPYSKLSYNGKAFLIIAGTFIGEPSDGRWHASRRKIAWEHDGRICELQQIIETSVPLETALRVAASCQEHTPTLFHRTKIRST